MYKVYSLADPRTNEVRYVGVTNSISRRMYQHIYWAKNSKRKHHVYRWIKELLELGLDFKVGILEDNLSQEEAFEKEIYWINKFDNLTNHDGGGKGFGAKNQIWKNRKHSKETKEKISQSQIGKKFNVDRKIAISKGRNPKKGDLNYRSKNNRGAKSKKVEVYDATTGNKLYDFTSILECSKGLNLSRTNMKKSIENNGSYKNFKFKVK